jgi:hypothetical protein
MVSIDISDDADARNSGIMAQTPAAQETRAEGNQGLDHKQAGQRHLSGSIPSGLYCGLELVGVALEEI